MEYNGETKMYQNLNRRTFLTLGASLLTLPLISQLSGCQADNKQQPEKKKVFSDYKFELLDLALQHEFGAVVQYGNHAGIIAALKKDSTGSINTIIRDIIGQEVHHAIQLTDILKKHDIEPTVAVWPPQTAETTEEMIKKDIAAEAGAIKLYQQILTLDFNDQTKRLIETIMEAEATHHHMFNEILPELS